MTAMARMRCLTGLIYLCLLFALFASSEASAVCQGGQTRGWPYGTRFPSLVRDPRRPGQGPGSSRLPYNTRWFTQNLDHFNFEAEPSTWQQRYLINTQYWNGNYTRNCPGPIFFYTGNESPVTDYWDNSGFVLDVLAPKLNGMVLMMEHRYFGKSQPFGAQSQQGKNIQYLSPEQALADYAHFLDVFKRELMPTAAECPVVAFGGSYGGMLTTWFRAKYPQSVIGGLAASAPFAFVGTGISPYTFMDTAQNTYATAASGCDTAVAQSFKSISTMASSVVGRATLSSAFKTCAPLSTQEEALSLLSWVENGLIDMAMLDYPYAADYGVNFPAWPVNTTCNRLLEHKDPVVGMAAGIQTFFNTTGSVPCVNVTKDVPDWGVCCAWNYLACTELYIPTAQRGMWYPTTEWNETADTSVCRDEFGVTLRPNWAKVEFGGFDLKAASNIIFSNGLLDPWHTSGVLHDLSPTLTAIVIPAAAHHLDLRGPHPDDPVYVTQAREQEGDIITTWIQDYFNGSSL